MSLLKKRYREERVKVEAAAYSRIVPFHNSCTVCEHTLVTNDVITPLSEDLVASDVLKPIPGFGAMYRLIGDGTHSPVFSSTFKKSSSSGDYDSTEGALNLVTFIFDGVDFWYSIVQAL